MRKNFLILVLFVLVAAVAGSKGQAITAASPGVTSTTGLFANCPVVALGTTQWCYTTTGIYQSLNGSAWAVLGVSSVPPTVTLTINGTQKTLPASFTLVTPTTITAQ